MDKLRLISFADSQYRKAQYRLANQARETQYFDSVSIYNEKNLSESFLDRHQNILNNSTRGYGYWIWKPHILLNTFAKCNSGDIVLYVDIGCHLIKNATE